MNPKLEEKVWYAGRTNEVYPKEQWLEIIHALVEDFQETVKLDFQEKNEAWFDSNHEKSPCFGIWLWTKDDGAESPLSNGWVAVMGGGMAGSGEEGLEDSFSVSLSMFAFDKKSKKRLCLTTGENVIEFIFQKQSDNRGQWVNLGWQQDEWGEWEDVEWG